MNRGMLLVLLAGPLLAAAPDCASLTGLSIPNTSIASAAPDPKGFCRVKAVSRPVADSEIHTEIWLPDPARWNGKFVGTGNGGYSGDLSLRDMQTALDLGYAVAGSDTGHTGGDLNFGAGHPEKIADWGYRAVHVMTQTSALVLRNYYGRFPAYSYFTGCSTGGHQAMSEAQRYPDDYDGIIAGAPGNNRVRLNVGFLWSWKATHEGDAPFPASKLPVLHQAVIAMCGGPGGAITEPRRCAFDPASLQCRASDTAACLTASEVAAARKVYAGARNPRTGEQIFPGWTPGSELGWGAYFVGHKEAARIDFWRLWVFNNPAWDPATFDFDRDVAYADKKMAATAAIDPDLNAFRKHGGKLIVYQGLADPVVPAQSTVEFFSKVESAAGGQANTSGFARLFLVPGMGHCGGGPAPSAAATLTALDNWVGKGVTPRDLANAPNAANVK